MLHQLVAGKTGSNGSETELQVALIAAGAALLTSLITLLLEIFRMRREGGRLELAGWREQLSELYGPVFLLRRESTYLYRKLKEGKPDPDNWHVLDHVKDVLDDDMDSALMKQIMAINGQVREIVLSKTGLIEGNKPPDSFVRFLGHYDTLTIALKNEGIGRVQEFEYFPNEFDDDVNQTYSSLSNRIDRRSLGLLRWLWKKVRK